jgi:hypothetical protein
MYVRSNKALLMHIYPKKADFGLFWTSFEKLALENTYFGCVTALPMYGDPCVTVTWPYISSCAYSTWPGGSSAAIKAWMVRHE